MFTTVKQLKAVDGINVMLFTRDRKFYRVLFEGQRYVFADKAEMLAWANQWLDHLLPA